MSERVTRRLVARGRVQGVWFRESMRQEASRLGIAGWVRNRLDGSVELMLQGPPGRLAELCAWLREGDHPALVESLDVGEVPAPFPRFDRFERLPTV